jgi:hypothetical protein
LKNMDKRLFLLQTRIHNEPKLLEFQTETHWNCAYSYITRNLAKETMSELRTLHSAISAMGMRMVSIERML